MVNVAAKIKSHETLSKAFPASVDRREKTFDVLCTGGMGQKEGLDYVIFCLPTRHEANLFWAD